MEATETQENGNYFRLLRMTLNFADKNYAAGRCLWFHLAMREAANLLCLAIEQAMKVLVIQKKLENNDLQSLIATKSGVPQHHYDPMEPNRNIANEILHHVMRCLLKNHNLIDLAGKLRDEGIIDLTEFEATISNVNRFYDLRYYSIGTAEIASNEIDAIDRIYFLLRSQIRPPLFDKLTVTPPIGPFDNNGQNLFAFTHLQNNSFPPPSYSITIPN